MRRTIVGLLACLLSIVDPSASAVQPIIVPIAPDRVGFTGKISPSLCWILIGEPPAGSRIKLVLVDNRSIQPILESQLPHSYLANNNETCQCVSLKDFSVELEPDVQYHWYVSLILKPESRKYDNIAVGGVIERCDISVCVFAIVTDRCNKEGVVRLAKQGIWYDAISCLCDLIKSDPDDKSLREMMHSLLRQGGLLNQNPYLIPLEK